MSDTGLPKESKTYRYGQNNIFCERSWFNAYVKIEQYTTYLYALL